MACPRHLLKSKIGRVTQRELTMRTILSVCAAALATISTQASAATMIYSDAAAFNLAAGATVTEDFSDGTLVPGLSITSSGGQITGGMFFDSVSPGDTTLFSFSSGQSAFGGIFNLADPGGPGLGLSLTLGLLGGGTETLSQEILRTCQGCFFGFTSTNPFVSVTFNPGTQAGALETFALDDLQIAPAQTAAVPEPTTWALMLLGFGLVGGAMRTRRSQKLAVS
jgi:hypothetical protein